MRAAKGPTGWLAGWQAGLQARHNLIWFLLCSVRAMRYRYPSKAASKQAYALAKGLGRGLRRRGEEPLKSRQARTPPPRRPTWSRVISSRWKWRICHCCQREGGSDLGTPSPLGFRPSSESEEEGTGYLQQPPARSAAARSLAHLASTSSLQVLRACGGRGSGAGGLVGGRVGGRAMGGREGGRDQAARTACTEPGGMVSNSARNPLNVPPHAKAVDGWQPSDRRQPKFRPEPR